MKPLKDSPLQVEGAAEAEAADVARLGGLAAGNLESEGGAAGGDWGAAGASPAGSAAGGDVHLHTADAELDFAAGAAEAGAHPPDVRLPTCRHPYYHLQLQLL